MAINDVAGGRVYHVRDIHREFPGHDFVSGLRTLKPKNLKNVLKWVGQHLPNFRIEENVTH